MSTSVNALFITQWEKETAMLFEQQESKLRNACRVVTGVGSTFSFPTMEGATAQLDKARHADVTPANITSARTPVTISTIHASEYIDDMDMVRTNTDLKMDYTNRLLGAVNRAIDTKIINALSATSNTALSVSNTLNTAGLAKATKTMLGNNIEIDGNWNAVISSGGVEDILNDAKLTSRDYVSKEMLESGFVKGVAGWNLIHSNLVDTDDSGTTYNNYFFHKDAVGLAIAKDVEMSVDWVPVKDAWLVKVKAAAGSVIIRPEGVQFAAITA